MRFRGAALCEIQTNGYRYGIRAFDTSPFYGPSEIVLGNALKALENDFPRSSYQIVRAVFFVAWWP